VFVVNFRRSAINVPRPCFAAFLTMRRASDPKAW
jgi:hypothetical protein